MENLQGNNIKFLKLLHLFNKKLYLLYINLES